MVPARATALLAAALALAALSCGGTGPYAPYTRVGGGAPVQRTQRIVILDRNVQDALLFVDSVQKRLPGGEILVQASFQNRFPNDDVWADVKFEFLDGNGMPLDETEWIKTLFPSWQVTTVQGNSIATGAASHVMLLRNLYTASGKKPIGPGRLFEIRGLPAVLPR